MTQINSILSNKKLKIIFTDDTLTDELMMTYQLYESQILERWWSLVKLSEFESGKFGAISFTGQLLDDEEFLVTTLNYFILKINTFVSQNNIPELHIEHTVEKNVSQKVLNDLHRYFEINAYDTRLKEHLKNTFRLMNLFIHRLENFSDGKKNNCVLIEITPADWKFLPLTDDDYSLFDLDWKWGQLVLNYCMLGVPTAQAFYNQSIPRPQNCFSAGMYLSFVDDSKFERFDELNSWLNSIGFNHQNPQCALGYIPLGILIDPIIPKTEKAKLEFLIKFKHYKKIKKIELIGSNEFLSINPMAQVPMDKIYART